MHDSPLARQLAGEQLPLFAGAVKAGVSYAGQLMTNTYFPVGHEEYECEGWVSLIGLFPVNVFSVADLSDINDPDGIINHIQHTVISDTDSPHIFFIVFEFFTPRWTRIFFQTVDGSRYFG